jgi:hypothetical protein
VLRHDLFKLGHGATLPQKQATVEVGGGGGVVVVVVVVVVWWWCCWLAPQPNDIKSTL